MLSGVGTSEAVLSGVGTSEAVRSGVGTSKAVQSGVGTSTVLLLVHQLSKLLLNIIFIFVLIIGHFHT